MADPHDDDAAFLAAEARRHDPDRYLCALLAPPDRRGTLFALTLLNHELARVPDLVSQPMLGLIRYQWWRDALDGIGQGAVREHPVVRALGAAAAQGQVALAALAALVDRRERAFEAGLPEAVPALSDYVADTSGALQRLSYEALGGADPAEAAAAGDIGTAWGLLGVAHAVALEAAPDPARAAAAAPRIAEILDLAGERLDRGRAAAGRPARALMPAFLPAPLAAARLAALRRQGAAAEWHRPALAPLALLLRATARRP